MIACIFGTFEHTLIRIFLRLEHYVQTSIISQPTNLISYEKYLSGLLPGGKIA